MTSVFQEKITKVYNALINRINSSISTHNSSSTAHSDIRNGISSSISTHNSSSTAHSDIRNSIPDISGKANTSDLATVATSGSYNDLNNKPTIPEASSTTPEADTLNGAVGLGTTWAKADHIHPKSTIYAEANHTHNDKLNVSDYIVDSEITSTSTNPVESAAIYSANNALLNGLDEKEDLTNKSSNITTDTGSTTKYPTVKAVEDYAEPKKEVGTFTELKLLIESANDGDIIVLDKDYINSDNIQSISTNPNKSIHINGNGHILNFKGSNSVGINMLANKSSIENCIIEESGGNSIVLIGDNCSISNCIFKLVVAGAVLTIVGANSYITDCIFLDNNSASVVLINIYSSGNGGKNFYVKNCLFFNNNVYSLIYLNHNSASVLFVDSCEFLNNTTIGGGIAHSNSNTLNNNMYSNCIFNNNIATGSNTGGAMTLNKSDTYSPILINNKYVTSNDTVYPTNLINKNYLTEHQDISGKANTVDLSDVATSGSYNDLTNKPSFTQDSNITSSTTGRYAIGTINISGSDITLYGKDTNTIYEHPNYSQNLGNGKALGLYKVLISPEGHIMNAISVSASDLPSHTHTTNDIPDLLDELNNIVEDLIDEGES